VSDDQSSRQDLPPGATNNKIEASTARTVFQAGRIGGDLVFNGVPGVEPQPGLVSIAPPFDRLVGKIHGRENVIAHLLGVARRSDGAAVVLHGRGGCGKTSVALETARRLSRDDPPIRTWWVDAGNAAALEAGLREVAFDAGACPSDIARAWSGESSAVELLGRVLGAARWPWLLIIDKADDHRVLTAWRPALTRARGTVLITSRDGGEMSRRGAAELILIGPLNEQSAVELLRSAAPNATGDAAELARALGYLPLALRLAGHYLNAARNFPPLDAVALPRDFDQYRVTFQQRFVDLDRLHEIGSGLCERELLLRTWELSLDLLAEHGEPLARPLLRWLSCFEQAPVPCVLLDHRVLSQSELFPGVSEMGLMRALVLLGDFGLVEQGTMTNPRSSGVSVSYLTVHPVIREANRHQTDVQEDFHAYLALCVAALDGCTSYLSTSDPRDLAQWGVLSPQCAYVVDRIHDARATFANAEQWELMGSRLTCAVAEFARLSGSYAFGEAMYRHALVVRLRYLGLGHPEVLTVRRELARLHWERNQARSSIEEYAALADDCAESLGDHELTLACLLDLALIRAQFGEVETIADEYRAVVRLSRKLSGRTDVIGLSAQMCLVKELWERGDATCLVEQFQLLSMLKEIGDIGGVLPIGLQDLRAVIWRQLRTCIAWFNGR